MDLEVRRVAVLEPAAGVFAVEEGCGRGFALTVSSTGPISIGSACSSTGVTRGVLGSKVRRTTGSPDSAEILRGEGSGLERVASEDSAWARGLGCSTGWASRAVSVRAGLEG